MPHRPTIRPGVSRAHIARFGASILERDRYACQACGAEVGDPNPCHPGKPVSLTFGYVAELVDDANVADYIRTECENCHRGFRTLPFPKSSRIALLTQGRRATPQAQRAALAWLSKKFATAPDPS